MRRFGAGKYSVRFSRLLPADAPALLEFARYYASCADGMVPAADWPQNLQGKLTARTPPARMLRVDQTDCK
ncbi:MAG: DUF1636 family protein [Gammaproteobacteria bacterium]